MVVHGRPKKRSAPRQPGGTARSLALDQTAGTIWYESMLQLSRTSQFADLAKITAQIAGDRFDVATKKAVKAAWKKVGL